MKKVLTFVVMLGCTLVASAQLSKGVQKELPSQFTQPELGIKVHPADNPFIKVPTDLQLHEDGLRLPFDIAPAKNMSRKAATAAITATADTAMAMYLGNYFYAYYKQWYGDIWQLTIWDTNKNKWMIQFTGTSAKRLDGEYTDASLTYVAGIDTIKATGTFNIKFAGTVMEKPTYKFSGAFSNTAGNTLTLNENPLAYTFPDNNTTTKDFWVFDYIYYYYCVAQGQLCGYVGIDLEDKEVEPTGDTIDIEITGAAVQKAYADGYYVGAQDESTYFSTFLLTDGATPVGHYDAEAIDLTQTQYYDMSDTSLVEIYKGISADVTATENGYNYIVRVMDMNGIQYNFIFDYVKPVITDTLQLSIVYDGQFNYASYFGQKNPMIVMYGSDTISGTQDTIYQLQMAYYTDSIYGKYTERNAYYGGQYDYIAQIVGKDTTYYGLESYQMQVGYYGKGYCWLVQLQAAIQNEKDKSDNKVLQLTMAVFDVYYNDINMDISRTYTSTHAKAIDATYYTQYRQVILQASNMVAGGDSSQVVLYFFLNSSLDATYTVPLGTYDVSPYSMFYYYKKDIANMSNGIGSNGYPEPSYLMIKQGGKLYYFYIVAGTVKVEADKITVKATNTYGKTINVVINLDNPTAIEQVQAPAAINGARKIMMNGQLYIVNGDALYNMQGFEVK